MGKIVADLKVGQWVSGEVIEFTEKSTMIVSLHGDLVSVKNETGREFTVGEMTQLIVSSVQPLSFRLPSARLQNRFDVTI